MIGSVWRLITSNPLLVSQAMASASGAYVMVAAAVFMNPSDFVHFALLVLLVQVVSGAVAAFLYQASLVQMRHDKSAHVKVGYVFAAAILAALIFGCTVLFFGYFSTSTTAVLAIASTAPLWSEWMRYRAMSLDCRGDLVIADGARLVASLLTPVVLWSTGDVALYFISVLGSWFLPFIVLVFRVSPITQFSPRRRYLRPASHLLTDFLAGQLMAAVPLLVLGGFGPSTYLGGVRLAQTVLGPLNLVFMAFAMNLAVDSVTRESLSPTAALITRGRSLARRLGGLATVLVPLVLLLAWISGVGFRGVSSHALLVGLALVGFLAILSGFASIDAVVLHLLGRNGLVAAGRVTLVTITTAGFVVGYMLNDVDGALVVGLVVAALTNPVVFVLPANAVYRKLLAAGGPPGPHDNENLKHGDEVPPVKITTGEET